MAYFLDLVSTETWPNFLNTDKRVAGFEKKRRSSAQRVNQGDIFLCYLTGLSRWCGALEVQSEACDDDRPRPGYGPNDPFTVRFRVKPLVVLNPAEAIPIKDCAVWST